MPFVESEQRYLSPLLTKIFYFFVLVWIVLFYAGTTNNLLFAWSTEEYSHGYLIPLVSLVWGIRLLQKTPSKPEPSIAGVLLLFLGIAFKFAGEIIANNWLSQISVVISITGLLGIFGGRTVLKRLAAPLFFLFFAIPLPATILPTLTAKMQLVSSDLGVKGLQLLGLSVFQEGNVIDLGTYKLEVAEACSGLRYLFPLMSLGYLVAFHAFNAAWKRWGLFLSTIPIAIVTNGLRITLTGIAVNWLGIQSIEGTLHELEGFVVFAICLAGLVVVKAGLDRFGKKEDRSFLDDFLPSLKFSPETFLPQLSAKIVFLSCLVIALSGAGTITMANSSRHPTFARQSFAEFPLHIKNWTGRTEILSVDELRSLKLTDYLLANFTQENSPFPVIFYVAFYESQRQGSSIHSPQICLPGAGWEIASRERKSINLGIPSIRPFSVNKEIIRKGEQKQLVYYWYRESGHDVSTNLEAKWQMMRSAFRSGRTDGSLIRFTTPIFGEQNEQKAEAILEAFMKVSLPLLPAYIPAE